MRLAFALSLSLLAALILAILMAAPTLNAFDAGLNSALTPLRARPLLHAAVWITGLGASPAVFVACLVASAVFWASKRVRKIAVLWIVWAGAEFTSWTLKTLIGRERPPFLDVASATSSSFPSGHSTMSMAIYGFLAYAIAQTLPTLGQRRLAFALTAMLIAAVGFSRMFLSVHFASDVLGGFALGGLWCLIGVATCRTRRDP